VKHEEMLKAAVKSLFASSPVWRGPGMSLRPRGVYVLMYHRIDDSQPGFHGLGKVRFEKQLNWLQRNCTLIDPDTLEENLARPPRRRPAVLLTFDDGYRCIHDIVAPALRRVGVRGLVFLPTDIIDSGGLIWTDRLNWAFRQSQIERIRFSWEEQQVAWPLETRAQRLAALSHCKSYLKQLPNEQRQEEEQQILSSLGLIGESEGLPRQMLDWDEVRATQDIIAYGGHTHTHPILSSLDSTGQEEEIATCQQRLAEELGAPCRYFAYPNGRNSDFNRDSQELLKRHGFNTAFSTEEGVATDGVDRLAIPRIPTTANSIADFAWLITHRG